MNHKNGKGHYKESSADPIARPLTPLTHRKLQGNEIVSDFTSSTPW